MSSLPIEIQVLLAQLAEGRAMGVSWEQLAHNLKKPVDELRALPFTYPKEWSKQMNSVRREITEASVNQTLVAMGQIMQGDDQALKVKAAATVAKIHQTRNREEDRRWKARLHRQQDAEATSAASASEFVERGDHHETTTPTSNVPKNQPQPLNSLDLPPLNPLPAHPRFTPLPRGVNG